MMHFVLSVVFARNVSLNKNGLKNVNAFDVFRGQTFGDSWQPIVRGP
jgi:hypothetical protein